MCYNPCQQGGSMEYFFAFLYMACVIFLPSFIALFSKNKDIKIYCILNLLLIAFPFICGEHKTIGVLLAFIFWGSLLVLALIHISNKKNSKKIESIRETEDKEEEENSIVDIIETRLKERKHRRCGE